MKFAIATLFTLALAMGVQSSWLPWAHQHAEIAGHGLSYTAVSSPIHTHVLAHHHAPAAVTIHESPLRLHGHGPAIVVGAYHHGPALIVDGHHAHHGAAVVVDAHHAHVPLVHHHAHEGEYVAKTRGAVHAAPLAGHVASVHSINLQPAPGTL